jgi:hypothetical protein
MAGRKATQEIVIELSNGVKGVFSGRAIAWPGQCENVNVVGVKFFAPKMKEPKKDVAAETPKTPPVPPASQSGTAQTPEKPSK